MPMHTRFPILVAALAIVGLTAEAQPARDGGRFPIDVEVLRSQAAAAFEKADADQDGLVSAAEFAAVDDGRERRGQRRGPGPGHRGKGYGFDLGDANGDGQLSREEFEALPAARRAAQAQRKFERLDADGDGGLSPSEFPSLANRLIGFDADGDGILTREEVRRGRRG